MFFGGELALTGVLKLANDVLAGKTPAKFIIGFWSVSHTIDKTSDCVRLLFLAKMQNNTNEA